MPGTPLKMISGVVQPPVHPPNGKLLRTTNKLQFLKRTVLRLRKHRDVWPFLQPVNAIEQKIPDYYNIIKNPMDLGTIQQRLNNHYYSCADECIYDINLVFNNCIAYNGRTNRYGQMACNVQGRFWELLKDGPPTEYDMPVRPPSIAHPNNTPVTKPVTKIIEAAPVSVPHVSGSRKEHNKRKHDHFEKEKDTEYKKFFDEKLTFLSSWMDSIHERIVKYAEDYDIDLSKPIHNHSKESEELSSSGIGTMSDPSPCYSSSSSSSYNSSDSSDEESEGAEYNRDSDSEEVDVVGSSSDKFPIASKRAGSSGRLSQSSEDSEGDEDTAGPQGNGFSLNCNYETYELNLSCSSSEGEGHSTA